MARQTLWKEVGPGFGKTPTSFSLDRISLELTNACQKGCSFCYNSSSPLGATSWSAGEVIAFVKDCAKHGIKAASLGGGEPLQFDGLYDVLTALEGTVFRSFTTNGLLLDKQLKEVVAARPDKIHVSMHFPERKAERLRVIRQVLELRGRGITSGVNLLVRRSQLDAAAEGARALVEAGIGHESIMFLPMRGQDTPTPGELAKVAASPHFQSMTCLLTCAASPRFASIGWDKRVGWCSYTESRNELSSLTFRGLEKALHGLALRTCGEDAAPALVQVGRPRLQKSPGR